MVKFPSKNTFASVYAKLILCYDDSSIRLSQLQVLDKSPTGWLNGARLPTKYVCKYIYATKNSLLLLIKALETNVSSNKIISLTITSCHQLWQRNDSYLFTWD